ncbi:hypothetical protein [Serratia entomophila]|uniref:hypothetical protein n=1 Tax=Serratia entomophila TaxID=42906 RepID=UPI0021BD13A9|nr:hypothetical protein [Serratia entomophila]
MNISDILTSAIYSNSVATIAMIVSLVAVPASGYLSYHYAIKGERRKEFNAVSDPIRQKLREQLRLIEQGYNPRQNSTVIDDREFDLFIDISSIRIRKKLQQLVVDYHEAAQNCGISDEYGKFTFTDADTITQKISNIMLFTGRK